MRLSTFPFELLAWTVTRSSLRGGLLLGLVVLAGPARAATFTVRNVNSAGVDSLRAALNAAALAPGPDTIAFAVPGAGPHTITLASPLPVITHPVTIDGYTQAGSAPATALTTAKLRIAIDASNVLRGIDIGGRRVVVRGLAIHSAQGENIFVEGGENVIAGNHIGTNVAGTAAVTYNGCNVTIYGMDNSVGGSAIADRNVIAGRGIGLCVKSGSQQIVGNRFGTNAAGTAALTATFGYGMMLESDASLVQGNLVSGNFVGIELLGDDNLVEGNSIGTNAVGNLAIPNLLGINVEGGDHNTIGGVTPQQGNLISGNEMSAIQVEPGDATDPEEEVGPADGNRILGNLIGTDASAAVPIPNGTSVFAPDLPAILVVLSNDTVIGGVEPGAGNIIAGNQGHGIELYGASDNLVLGNWIGTNPSGASGLGNGGSGVYIDGSAFMASANQIGDIGDVPLNVIAHNADDGVSLIGTAPDNTIVHNLIFANGAGGNELGIDLNDDGLTANDANDVDSGPNELLNHPEVLLADALSGTVNWSLDGLSATPYRLEFYANDTCDASGSGEGQRYLGSVDIVTAVTGVAAGSTPLPAGLVELQQVSMTATRSGPGGLRATSEFSPCREVQ